MSALGRQKSTSKLLSVLYVFDLMWVHLQKGKMVIEKIKTGQHMTNWKLKGALGFPDWKIQNECEQWIVV